ncbi:hypothetical protein ACJX0J_034295, partial [Zea mays]
VTLRFFILVALEGFILLFILAVAVYENAAYRSMFCFLFLTSKISCLLVEIFAFLQFLALSKDTIFLDAALKANKYHNCQITLERKNDRTSIQLKTNKPELVRSDLEISTGKTNKPQKAYPNNI